MWPYPHTRIFTAGLLLQGAAVDALGKLWGCELGGWDLIACRGAGVLPFTTTLRSGPWSALCKHTGTLRPNIRTFCADMYRGVRMRTHDRRRHQDYSSLDGNQRQYFFFGWSQEFFILKPFIKVVLRIYRLLEHKLSPRFFGINIFFQFWYFLKFQRGGSFLTSFPTPAPLCKDR